jgi:hypothetical protein
VCEVHVIVGFQPNLNCIDRFQYFFRMPRKSVERFSSCYMQLDGRKDMHGKTDMRVFAT